MLNVSGWADAAGAHSVRSNRERAVWYLVESSRRSGDPSLSDLESSLVSGEMGSNAMLHVGALLLVAKIGALELPACIDRQGFFLPEVWAGVVGTLGCLF